MSVSLQVIYPVTDQTTFDFDYYLSTHMDLVGQYMGPHIANTVVVRGQAGPEGSPAGYHAIATILFDDQSAFDGAMAAAGPVVEDIAKFYNGTPQMLVGEVVG